MLRRLVLLGLIGAGWQLGQDIIFRQDVKLVEVYATVVDHKGREIDGLTKDQFELRDNGKPQPIRVFEPASGALTCALLVDTTGSMTNAMPSVRNAARRLIDSFRPNDLVGLYTFSEALRSLQDVTNDHAALKSVLAQIHTGGRTAFYDSLTQLAIDMEKRAGKKAIIVLTDGEDNDSVLNPFAAAERIKNTGVPVFAIAEGNALENTSAAGLMRELADATGGGMYSARRSKDIEGVFEEIGRRVRAGYLLAFSPTLREKSSSAWHEIEVLVKNTEKPVRVKARGGYSFE